MENAQEMPRQLAGESEADPAAGLREAQNKLLALNERTVAFVREHPIVCVVGAMSLGFIVGKIAARS